MNRITLHPEILSKNGKKEFVVLPYEEFLALQELLDDIEDLLELRAAKREDGDEPSTTLADAKKELGLA
jgi:PHD/YefM family antitoxin component YafN of YafNO toxin-antitoxin module